MRMAATRIFDAHAFTATFRLNFAVRVKFENRCREVVAQQTLFRQTRNADTVV